MARLSGKDGYFKVDVTGGTPAEVLAVTSWSLNITGDNPETTGMDGNGWRGYVDGLRGWSVSADCHFDTSDTKLVGAVPVIFVGRILDWEGISDSAYGYTWSGQVIVTAMNVEVAVDGTVDYTIEAIGNSTLTPPAAAITTSTTTSTTTTTTTSTTTTTTSTSTTTTTAGP